MPCPLSHSHKIIIIMSQFNHMQITCSGNVSPTMEQLLREGDGPRWSPAHPATGHGKEADPEEDIDHPQKKSVFAKVREKAKKLRYSLSIKKKHGEDENTTPSWGYNLDEDEELDEDDVDAEYLGAPMYESELAPDDCRENARQHPRADPVIAENHVLANTMKLPSGRDQRPINSASETLSPTRPLAGSSLGNIKTTTKAETEIQTSKANSPINEVGKPTCSPGMTLTQTVTEKLAPVYSSVSDATHAIASKIQSLTVSAPLNLSVRSLPTTPNKAFSPTIQKTCSSSRAPQSPKPGKGTEQIWDKGVSVKEYLMHKFEPGEDDRALSQVLSDALSPRTNPRGVGVVEKMREAVTSMLRAEAPQPKATHLAAKSPPKAEEVPQEVHLAAKPSLPEATPQPMVAHLAAKSSSNAPIFTTSYRVAEEENLERILQAN